MGLGLLTYGFIEAGSVGWSDYRTVFALIVGLIFITLFVIVEKRIERRYYRYRYLKTARFYPPI